MIVKLPYSWNICLLYIVSIMLLHVFLDIHLVSIYLVSLLNNVFFSKCITLPVLMIEIHNWTDKVL